MKIRDAAERAAVSVILPMYNAEKYVDSLMEDMAAQTFENVEFICVDDGSDDTTGEKIRTYAKENACIHYAYQDNAGAGIARNHGLSLAQGEYCIFLDSDDRYAPQLVENLYTAAKGADADIAVCLFNRVNYWFGTDEQDIGYNREKIPVGRPFAGRRVRNFLRHIDQGPINKLYRTAFIRAEGLRYSNTRIANDCFFALAALISAKRIICIPDALLTVHRYINPNSISATRAKNLCDIVTIFSELFDWIGQDSVRRHYQHQAAFLFQAGVYYNAQYAIDRKFTTAVVQVLMNDPPFSKMNLATLQEKMRLDLQPIRNRIARLEKERRRTEADEVKNLDIQIRFKKNLLQNISGIDSKLTKAKGEEHKTTFQRGVRKLRSMGYRVRWSVEDNGWIKTLGKVEHSVGAYVVRIPRKTARSVLKRGQKEE